MRTADALTRAQHVGDPVLLFWAAMWRSVAAECAGDIGEMDRCDEIMASLVEQLGQPSMTWCYCFMRVPRALIAGDTDRAEQFATEALQVGTDSGQPDINVFFSAHVVSIASQRGTMNELVSLIEQATSDNPGIPSFNAGLAVALVEGDRTEEARNLLMEFASAGFELPLDLNWITGMVFYAETAIHCGEPRYAEPLFERLAPWADQWSNSPGGTNEGPVKHFLGGLATVLGRYDAADAYFSEAVASSDREGAKFFAARTDLLWGKMLTDRRAPGDIERARELLTMAHTAAATHGYGTVERRAATALQLLGR